MSSKIKIKSIYYNCKIKKFAMIQAFSNIKKNKVEFARKTKAN